MADPFLGVDLFRKPFRTKHLVGFLITHTKKWEIRYKVDIRDLS